MCTLGTFETVLLFIILYLTYFLFLRDRLKHFLRRVFMGRRFHFILHFLNASLLGLSIELSLSHISHDCHFPPLVKFETSAVDSMMNFWVKKQPNASLETYLYPIVWLDIDEKTYEDLGEPLGIPRDYLWRLIELSIINQPRLVIVDFAVDRPIEQQRNKENGETELIGGDKVLADCLAHYSFLAEKYSGPPASPCFDAVKEPLISFPPIILAKGLRILPDTIEERPSLLIENIVAESPVLFWASPTFQKDPIDYSVRHWRLFEHTVRLSDNRTNVLPSIPLLTWAILRQPSLDEVPFETRLFLCKLRDTFSMPRWTQEGSATTCRPSSQSWKLESEKPLQTVNLSRDLTELEQRVPYLVGGTSKEEWLSPTIKTVDGQDKLLFSRRAARELLREPDATGILEANLKELKDSVVIIGASYQDSRDFHITPIGEVSGALWMSNAIEGILEYGQLQAPHRLEKWFWLLTSIFIIALIFVWTHSIRAPILGIAFVILILAPFSIYRFQSGVWLDFTLPILGVLGHRLVEKIEEAFKPQSSRGV